ncbi:MAG: hypothetical protein NTV86_12180 [Planctomycetota bacterium]|nr:hypothetical protein [Planctomycetota bacterium]
MAKLTRNILAAVLTAAVMLAGAAARAGDEKPDAPVKGELPPRLRLLKNDFDRLVKLMLEAAQVLEKSDPEAAKSLREAVDLAQRAFIAENLGQAATELEKGLAGKAMTIQNDVGKDLDELIRLLRYGTLGLDEKLRRLETYKEQLARIEKHLAQEKEQQEITRAKLQAEKIEADLAAHAKALEEIAAAQKALHEQAGKMKPVDGAMEKALALRNEVRNLLAKQQVLREKTESSPMPRLTKAGVMQDIMGDRAGALGKELEAAGKDSAANELARGSAEAAAKVAQAAGAMKQAAGAMGKMDRPTGLGKQDEAIKNLTEADKALTKAIEGTPPAGAAAEMAARQGELAKKTDQLGEAMKATAQAAGAQADTGKLAEASGQMQQAAGKLSEVQPAPARDHMAKALEALKDQQAKLASLSEAIKKKAQTPADKQAGAQKDLASEAGKTAAGTEGADSAKTSPGQPNAEKAAGERGTHPRQAGARAGDRGNAGAGPERAVGADGAAADEGAGGAEGAFQGHRRRAQEEPRGGQDVRASGAVGVVAAVDGRGQARRRRGRDSRAAQERRHHDGFPRGAPGRADGPPRDQEAAGGAGGRAVCAVRAGRRRERPRGDDRRLAEGTGPAGQEGRRRGWGGRRRRRGQEAGPRAPRGGTETPADDGTADRRADDVAGQGACGGPERVGPTRRPAQGTGPAAGQAG